jgi:hypothetical protein
LKRNWDFEPRELPLSDKYLADKGSEGIRPGT